MVVRYDGGQPDSHGVWVSWVRPRLGALLRFLVSLAGDTGLNVQSIGGGGRSGSGRTAQCGPRTLKITRQLEIEEEYRGNTPPP